MIKSEGDDESLKALVDGYREILWNLRFNCRSMPLDFIVGYCGIADAVGHSRL